MTKFTDEQIIKAMQCVIGNGVSCSECEYQKALPFPGCRRMCAENALALISRYKAENERLEDENYTLKNKIEIRDNLIEQLGSDIDVKYNTIYTMREKLKNSKSEAIKRFAERLKERLNTLEYTRETDRKTVPTDYFVHMMNDILHETVSCVIDSILKEMTEG